MAVVTPYFDECEAWMRQCHQSVAAQAHPCLHVMVADGRPAAFVEDWAIEHVRLPVPHGDFGATPRLVGAYHAIGLGYDAIAFLDADNWYEAGHVERLTQLQMATGAAFLSSGRVLRRLDGSAIGPCPVTDPESFVDTSCMMFAREAFGLLAYWTLMPAYAQVIGDRVMLHHVRASGLKRAHLDAGTVNYRCGKSGIYSQLNEPIPEGVHPPPDYDAAFERWAADGNPSLWPASGCR